jgi:hypothetical protein
VLPQHDQLASAGPKKSISELLVKGQPTKPRHVHFSPKIYRKMFWQNCLSLGRIDMHMVAQII